VKAPLILGTIMAHQKIWQLCTVCNGTGEIRVVPIYDEDGNKIGEETLDCAQCDGVGRLIWGYLET
jgi:hypothetical protein